MKVIVAAITLSLVTLLIIPTNMLRFGANAEAVTTVFVDPATIENAEIGETVTVNVNVSNVKNLYGWQAGMTFNSEVLNCIGYYQGEFLKRAINRPTHPANGTLWFDSKGSWGAEWNNTEGLAYDHGCTVLGPVPGVDGSGQLGYLTFEVVGTGTSDLHLTDVMLVEVIGIGINATVEEIPHEVVDIFTVSVEEVDYSVKTISNLTGIMNSPNPISAGLIHHTFSPQEKAISFDVITEYDNFLSVIVPTDLLGSDLKVLVDNNRISYSLTKNDTHASLYFTNSPSTHNIKIKENVRISPDLNNDGIVNIIDITTVAAAFKTKPGDARWNPIADVNQDGKIDIVDINIVAVAFNLAT